METILPFHLEYIREDLGDIALGISNIMCGSSSSWVNISEKPVSFFYPLMRKWRNINLEYDVLRALLRRSLEDLQNTDTHSFARLLIAALLYAEILEKIHQRMNNLQEIQPLQDQQNLYREHLESLGMRFAPLIAKQIMARRFSDNIRTTTADTNWPRLFIVRLKRAISSLLPFFKNIENFRRSVILIDAIANPLFAYLAWLFYVPRFSVNVFNTLKNTWNPGMEKIQKDVLWQFRLWMHWDKLWFELCNDGVWMAVGLINCFLLTGVLAPAGLYLTIALYMFDVVLAGVRAGLEIRRFKLFKNYEKDSVYHSEEFSQYQKFRSQKIHYEKARLALSVGTTSALFLGMCFALPMLAVNPVIPCIGACFIVLVSLISFFCGKKVESLKPEVTLSTSSHSFFHQTQWTEVGLRYVYSAPAELSAQPNNTEDAQISLARSETATPPKLTEHFSQPVITMDIA